MISLRGQVMRQYSQYLFRMQQYTTATTTAKLETINKRTDDAHAQTEHNLENLQKQRRQSVEIIKKSNANNAIQLQQQALKQAKKEQRLLEQKKKAEKASEFKNYLTGLPVLQYPKNYKVKCISNVDDANNYIAQLLRSNNKKFGLDLEWPPVFVKGQKENKVALVQICDADVIGLIQLSRMKEVPSELRKFLERKDILKSGVNIRQDGLKIYRDYGILTNGLVELTDMAEDSNSSKLERVHLRSLRALSGLFLEQHMPKGKVRVSNWGNVNLTSTQIKYAANDAYASYALYCILEKLCENPIRINHLINENIATLIPPQKPQKPKSIEKPRRNSNSNTSSPMSTTEVLKRKVSQ